MNLLHHLVVAERLRERLGWGTGARAQMLLGAIAPDAHTFVPAAGRPALHPPTTADPAAFVMEALEPADAAHGSLMRAFALSCVGHLVADELTRRHRYHLPPHAPSGFAPAPQFWRPEAKYRLDVGALVRCLVRARVRYWLRPLTPEAIDAKRWEVLGRYPLDLGTGVFVVVEPLASAAQHCTDQTLLRLSGSDVGLRLLWDGARRR